MLLVFSGFVAVVAVCVASLSFCNNSSEVKRARPFIHSTTNQHAAITGYVLDQSRTPSTAIEVNDHLTA